MRGGKYILIILLLLSINIVMAQNTPQTDQNANFRRYVSQEGQKTRDYVKNELDAQLDANTEKVQDVINENKAIFFNELNHELKIWAFKISIILFSVIVMSLITYQLIMIRVKRKYKNLDLRTIKNG